MISAETWITIDEPEMLYCFLFDDIAALKQFAQHSARPCTPVDLRRLAAVLLSLQRITLTCGGGDAFR